MAQSEIRINVKKGEDTRQLQVNNTGDVNELRQKVAELFDTNVGQVTLVFAGRILRDGITIYAAGLRDGQTVHAVVRSAQRNAAPPQPQPTRAPQPVEPNPQQPTQPTPPATPPASFDNAALRGMLNSEMIDNLIANPNIINELIARDPQAQAILNSQPQLRQAFNDPQFVREVLNMMRASSTDDNSPVSQVLRSMMSANSTENNNQARPFPMIIPFPVPSPSPSQTSQSGPANPPNPFSNLFNFTPPPPPPPPPPSRNEWPSLITDPRAVDALHALHESAPSLFTYDPLTAVCNGDPNAGRFLDDQTRQRAIHELREMFLSMTVAREIGQYQYDVELEQLNGMGFTNRSQNLRALREALGDVNRAVEILLNAATSQR